MKRKEGAELLPFIKAFGEGKDIEIRSKNTHAQLNGWAKMDEFIFGNFEYRIKPESKCRPFKDAKECMAEMLKHHPFGFITSQCAFFHVIYIEDKLIGYGSACGAILHTKFNDALESFTFADCVPFGVKVEE